MMANRQKEIDIMKTVNEIKQEMELVEIVKSALDVNGQDALNLIKQWTNVNSKNENASMLEECLNTNKEDKTIGEYIRDLYNKLESLEDVLVKNK